MSSMAGSFPVTRHPEVPAAGGPRRTTADVRFNSLAIYSASSAYLLPLPMGEREPDERASIDAIRSRSAASRRDRNLADVLRHLVALLRRRTLGDGRVPALDVGILAEIDGLPLVARHPRPNGDIRDRIVVRHVFMIGEPPV